MPTLLAATGIEGAGESALGLMASALLLVAALLLAKFVFLDRCKGGTAGLMKSVVYPWCAIALFIGAVPVLAEGLPSVGGEGAVEGVAILKGAVE